MKKINSLRKVDFIICETRFFESSWWTPLLAKIWQVPCILVDHCASHIVHPSIIISLIGKILDHTIIRYILNKFDIVAVSNSAVRDFLKEHLKIKKVKLIGTGVDNQFFTPKKREIRKNGIRVTFLARLIESKGAKVFLASIKPLLFKYPNIRVTIAGEGPLYQELKNQITKNKLSSRVILTGALSYSQVSLLLSNTDIFVHPSFHHEGIPNVILEAGASGCAVIATNKGGTNEIIINGKTGILLNDLKETNLSSAIEELVVDQKKRLKLAQALHVEINSRYQWIKVAANILDLLIP